MAQRINEQIGTATAVKPEGHFFKVGRKMFYRDFMPRANDATLEQRKSGFNAVSRNVRSRPHENRTGIQKTFAS